MISIVLFCSLLPLYDFDKSFTQNLQSTPEFFYEIPYIKKSKKISYSLFGYPIRSPIGIPACAIMTSKGIAIMSKLGFDIFTYKTIRSVENYGHPLPNICFVNCDKQLTKNYGTSVTQIDQINSIDAVALANSFGNNALSLQESCADITRAREALSQGQLLIVSIFGSGSSQQSCAKDFAYVAAAAVHAGAHVIEANLSCPNLDCGTFLYKQPEMVFQICSAISTAVSVPLIIKVGIFDNQQQMKETLRAASKGGARGVCGINAVPMRVETNEGFPYFGNNRKLAGVSGNPIRSLALDFVTSAKKIIDEEQLDLVIFATGGIIQPEHFCEFFAAGATIAMSATGAMVNPNLAIDYIKQKKES